ncbi:MAG TPA: hypothetical protein VGJ73_05755 [Verrucomicrobiae bacterium]|jgi:hypothetical protein
MPDNFYAKGMFKDMWSVKYRMAKFSANGATHTSLGHRPRAQMPNVPKG